jgi:RNA polymerase sigma-70 factor (ECF subfamily)
MPQEIEYERSLARRASRDPVALQALYKLYFHRVYNYVSVRINHAQDTEDLVSDIFLQVVKNLSKFNNRYELSFGAWVFTIARHVVIDYYRQQGCAPQELKLEETAYESIYNSDPCVLLIEREKHFELYNLLNLLPDRRRKVVTLKYFGGLRNLEIAEIMGIDERTVASHLSRGLKDLYEAYKKKLKTHENASDVAQQSSL